MSSIVPPTTIEIQYGPAEQFAKRQKDFETASQRIVLSATQEMKKISHATSTLAIPLFHQLMADFARERKQLDVEANPSDAASTTFGVRPKETFGDFFSYTNLAGIYKPANDSALKQLSERTQSISFDGKKFDVTPQKTTEKVLGRQFSCETQILDAETVRQQTTYTSKEDSILRALGAKVMASNSANPPFELDRQIKKEHPEMHKKNRLRAATQEVETNFPSPKTPSDTKYARNRKSHYILTTMRTQIGKQMFATAQWLTWLGQIDGQDPRQQLLDPDSQPIVIVLPQDLFLHDETLAECAKLFEKILTWDKATSSVDDLKDQMALFRYLFAHVSPYLRGSAAIGEWFEQSLYDFLGLSCSYTPAYPKESVDLVALTKLKFSDYLERYHTLVHVLGEQQGLTKPASLETKDPK